ncbi:MAG: 30S ribosomal protein S3 [Spirochaetales bacterium]|nr:30S ribosomal protein S3 [Spirochaetales bacterium]
MGQKVNPYGIRLNVNKYWKSKWYAEPKDYAKLLHEDLQIRRYIEKSPETTGAEVSDVEIIRHPQRVTVIIHSGRPGAIIGAKGVTIEKLGNDLQKKVGKKVQIKIKEIRQPETVAQLIADNIARQLKNRMPHRRVMKMAISNAMKSGVQGIKIKLSGRLGGAEIARREEYKEGRVPLHTFRADIDYATSTSVTTFGTIGVKVWIFHGEVFDRDRKDDAGLLLKKHTGKARSEKEDA